ncbi:MAG TPA: pyridoxamine 5'-phosphate oxidase family protein [Caulobacter sp.]|nr:pyridoxamine 5'-phosphate oxidase family protein [Caulobacter sp.]
MSKEAELTAKFWKALKSDRNVMLGLPEIDGGHSQPMSALIDGDHSGPMWMFTASETDLVQALDTEGRDALMHFASKGHDLFAVVEGRLRIDTDYETVERLWNPFTAAWFEGKDDPRLRLLRFDPADAQIWLNENSFFAGVRLMLGMDPKEMYRDKVAEVRLH